MPLRILVRSWAHFDRSKSARVAMRSKELLGFDPLARSTKVISGNGAPSGFDTYSNATSPVHPSGPSCPLSSANSRHHVSQTASISVVLRNRPAGSGRATFKSLGVLRSASTNRTVRLHSHIGGQRVFICQADFSYDSTTCSPGSPQTVSSPLRPYKPLDATCRRKSRLNLGRNCST